MGWEVGGILHPGTSVRQVPQFLQGVNSANTQLVAQLAVADIDVEGSDDGGLAEILRDDAVDDAPEPPDVVAQRLFSFLL